MHLRSILIFSVFTFCEFIQIWTFYQTFLPLQIIFSCCTIIYVRSGQKGDLLCWCQTFLKLIQNYISLGKDKGWIVLQDFLLHVQSHKPSYLLHYFQIFAHFFLIEESHYIHAGFFSSFWKYIYDYVNSIYTDEDDLFWWNNWSKKGFNPYFNCHELSDSLHCKSTIHRWQNINLHNTWVYFLLKKVVQ